MKSEFIIQIFEAAGYLFIKENPNGTLIFYHQGRTEQLDFVFDKNTRLKDVMALIVGKAYDIGFIKGQSNARTEMKHAIGLM